MRARQALVQSPWHLPDFRLVISVTQFVESRGWLAWGRCLGEDRGYWARTVVLEVLVFEKMAVTSEPCMTSCCLWPSSW